MIWEDASNPAASRERPHNPRDRNFEVDREEADDNVNVVDENCGEESIDPLNMPSPSSLVPNARAPMAGRCGRCMSPSLGFSSPLVQASTSSPIQRGPISAPRINPIFLSSSKSRGSNARRLGSTGVRR